MTQLHLQNQLGYTGWREVFTNKTIENYLMSVKGENYMHFYVFRIDYGACYDLIKKELLEHKKLRQGWG